MIVIFLQKFWSVNSTLVQERHVYACAEFCVTKFFYAILFPRNFSSLAQVSCKTIKGFQSYLNPPPPPPTPPLTHTDTHIHTHIHIILGILLSPWHIFTNLQDLLVNHCQYLSQIYHLLCYPWSPLFQNVETSKVKYSFNTSEFGHILIKSLKFITIKHLQKTLSHKHSGKTQTYTISVP